MSETKFEVSGRVDYGAVINMQVVVSSSNLSNQVKVIGWIVSTCYP